MPGLAKSDLHIRVLEALRDGRPLHGPVDDVPLLLDLPRIMPVALWAFTLTNPPGGRHPSESKIQIMVPGQDRRERANFIAPEGRFKLLVGVHPVEDVFVLWDAYKQRDFPWSKNVQVRGPIVWDAQISGIASGTRKLQSGSETVIAARADHLEAAIRQRIDQE